MTVTRRVSTRDNKLPNDVGLNKLFKFIRTSLATPNDAKRDIKADASYSFIVYIAHSSGKTEERVVRIPKGRKLHFFRADSQDRTNPDRFMFDEGDHSWVVNVATGVVVFRNDNIHLPNRMAGGKFNGKIANAGLSLG